MQKYVDLQIERLNALNQVRLARAKGAMHSQAVEVFNLLPVLLHFNHPAIPGYVERSVICGIANFFLTPFQHEFISEACRAFGTQIPERAIQTHYPIKGMFAMGSTGTMGQSLTSDLDIWVCIQPWVSQDARAMLDEKYRAISRWAMAQGVEVNFFTMCEQHFRHHLAEEMTSDNCGSTQHFLLLDEFYRSAVHLAGLPLLWHIVPAEQEHQYDTYVKQLTLEGVITPAEWVDFGPLPSIPAEEYFGSSLWQLYKSIDSPYKSVLKAILLEAYSWEYSNTKLLSIESKKRFHRGCSDLYQSDAYLLMLDKATHYLQTIKDERRLDLVRRCFYLKTHEKLTRQPELGSVPWRREAMQLLTSQWGWTQTELSHLDNRRSWKVEATKEAHQELIEALMLSYRNLIHFARRNDVSSAVSPEELSILARKLYAAFEVLPGKVTLLNSQLAPDLYEPNLSLIQVAEGKTNPPGWYLYKQSLQPTALIGRAPLEHNRYLSKLVAWSYFNGLLTDSTDLHLVSNDSQLDLDKLYQFVSDLRNTFSRRLSKPSLKALASPCEISRLALFINLEQDPTDNNAQLNKTIDIKNIDVLSGGDAHQCLIGSVDLVYINSWNEVRTANFKGSHAILDVLKTVLSKMHQDALAPESIDVFCYSSKMRGVIRNAIYQLMNECIEMRLKPVDDNQRRRFKAIRIADQTFGLFFERRGVSVQRLENSVEFYRAISSNKVTGSALYGLNKNHIQPPDVVDAHASEGLIQFFFEDCDQGFNIYVLDENNAVEMYRQCSGDKEEMVQGLNRFYTSNQEDAAVGDQKVNFNLPQFYHIAKGADGRLQVKPFKRERQWSGAQHELATSASTNQ